jgi:hypothetical protein
MLRISLLEILVLNRFKRERKRILQKLYNRYDVIEYLRFLKFWMYSFGISLILFSLFC